MRDYKLFSFYKTWCKPALTFEWGSYFSPYPQIHLGLGWGSLYIDLPYNTGRDECENPRYGFYLYGEGKFFESLWFCWGMKYWCINMPWSLTWVRTSFLRKDGNWEHDTNEERLGGDSKQFWDKDKWKDILWSETHPYRYILKSGKIQDREARIMVEEMEWRPRWFKWTSLFSKVRKYINIEFDGEVGERSGSWKGGTVGCGYTLLPNETPLQCLRRMESEREF
jgi:hypothetical protein